MTRSLLRHPDEVRDFIARRYRRQQGAWLAGAGQWPMPVPLGCPGEVEARDLQGALGAWVDSWRAWTGPGTVAWTERRWRELGAHRLPAHLMLAGPADAAFLAGEERRWENASGHHQALTLRWPALAKRLGRWFDELAASEPRDAATVAALLEWFAANPDSQLFPRQLPIAGMDTKWLEPRLPMLADLASAIRADAAAGLNPWEICGLRQPAPVIRIRLLDAALRGLVGGVGDLSVPLSDWRTTELPVERVYIVENLQTGLAFDDMPGAVVAMGLGYAVGLLAEIPWIARAECIYWGDIDTHGFAILSRARAALPNLRQVMMDETTLLRYRDLWVREAEQVRVNELLCLTEDEDAVFRGLKQQRWGSNIRLEQERIAWDDAMREVNKL